LWVNVASVVSKFDVNLYTRTLYGFVKSRKTDDFIGIEIAIGIGIDLFLIIWGIQSSLVMASIMYGLHVFSIAIPIPIPISIVQTLAT